MKNVVVEHLFNIYKQEGKYYATRDVQPLFCVRGATIKKAARKAQRALQAYDALTKK